MSSDASSMPSYINQLLRIVVGIEIGTFVKNPDNSRMAEKW
jgi:hypothetical protein